MPSFELDRAKQMILESLNSGFSTTRRVTRTAPGICEQPETKLQRQLFSPHHPERRGEGGLRTKGYFKAGGSFNQHSEAITIRPLVTVITAVFNGAKYLDKTILSVLNQTYDNVEYIIIDGGSTDGTLDIIRKYEHTIDYWVSEPDAGIYDAWNKGVRLAGGDWIAFLGADDFYMEGAVQAYMTSTTAYHDGLPEYVSSRVNLISDLKLSRTVGHKWNWKTFRKYMNVAHVGSLHRRTLFETYGLYDTTYKVCGDYEFLLRPGSSLRAAYLSTVTVNMRIGGMSDRKLQAICEATRAKVTTGKRSALLSHIDKLVAVCKWKLRKLLWY